MRLRILKLSLNILISFIASQAGAAVSFFYYGIENGLPETRIISITQDSTGFIWLAGENSLFRFDGTHFKSYYYTETSNGSLFQGKISGLFTDRRGVLWIGGENGIVYYNFMSDRFERVPELERVHITGISEDEKGNIWIGSDEGLACLNSENLQTDWYTGKGTLKTNGIQVLPVDAVKHVACEPGGKVWFTSGNGELYLFDQGKREVSNFTVVGDNRLDLMTISHLKFYDSKIYIGTINNGLLWIDSDDKSIHSQNFAGNGYTIQQFFTASDSLFWLASNNGLISYNPKNQAYTILSNVADNPNSLIRTANIFVYVDRDNNLWVSNGINGINYGVNITMFNHFDIADNGLITLTHKEVTSINFQGDDILWLGYEAGFIEKRSLETLALQRYESASLRKGRPLGSVMCIFNDAKNQIWAGGWRTGLQKLNSNKEKFEYPPVNPARMKETLETADVRGITQDKNGNIWFTMHGQGIGCYNPQTFEMKNYRFNENDPVNGLSNDYTFDLCVDNDNNIWISSAYGLSKLNPASGKFSTFLHSDSIPNSLSSDEINTVICDKSGVIWAGTSNGLNVYNAEINAFQPVLTDREMPFLNIRSILSVKPNEIWASTQSGIISLKYSWDTESSRIRFNSNYFDHSDGLISSTFFPRSAAISRSGELYFGGNEGVDYFRPEKVLASVVPEPAPVIIGMSINGVPITKERLKKEGKNLTVILRHTDRMFTLAFTSFRFNNWGLKKFRYKLEDFSDQWTYTENEQVATFASLPPGKYRFFLEVAGNNSGWQGMVRPLEILVKPPFWMTWTFVISIVSLVFLVVYLYHRRRSLVLIARQQELEQIIEKRTAELVKKNDELEIANQTKSKFFSIVSHDLRSPFSALIGIIELLNDPDSELDENKKRELLRSTEISAKNTFDFLETLLTWARSQMNQTVCNPAVNNLSLLLSQNIELKTPVAAGKGIIIKKHLPDKLDAFFDVEMINTVVRNILSNSIKFTKHGGMIEVTLKGKRDEAEVFVADTGIGMSGDEIYHLFDLGKSSRKGTMGERGTGLGLIICKEFIEKNKGRIWVTANKPQGTVFHFTLPIREI